MSKLQFDSHEYPYASKRTVTVANNGMVATSQPLAAQAGLDILKKGGNAVDAAIATAAALTVVEPTTNGIGGDAFALVWMKDELHGLSATGAAPKSISIEKLKAAGHEEMPRYGWSPVTVPGVPSAWAELSERFGKLPLIDVLQPAIYYAEKGYPVSPILAQFWDRAYQVMEKNLKGDKFDNWFETFGINGRAPKVGEVWSSPNHASTLREIGETNARSFYEGNLAEKIAEFSKATGGYLTKEDLESYQPEWVDPISVSYRGYDVWEIPPSTQGLVPLIALNILENFDFSIKDSVDTYHKQIEAIKLAFADGYQHITDPAYMEYEVEAFLSKEYAKERSQLIGDEAMIPEPGQLSDGGTVYLATADSEGNMVSYIQSNYRGFGSGLIVPETGIALQNRGADFSLNTDDANALVGGKKPFHTIIPGFLTKDNQPIGPFGVMGGAMQPQAHVQLVMDAVDFHLNPQASLDAPRWQWVKDKEVLVEPGFPKHIAESLTRKGHEVKMDLGLGTFGRGQIIWYNSETKSYFGGTDGRTDGIVASY